MKRIVEAILGFVNGEQGQDLAEYGLIVALIAVAMLLALTAFGLAIAGGSESIGDFFREVF